MHNIYAMQVVTEVLFLKRNTADSPQENVASLSPLAKQSLVISDLHVPFQSGDIAPSTC